MSRRVMRSNISSARRIGSTPSRRRSSSISNAWRRR
jgi:hypothetical protein